MAKRESPYRAQKLELLYGARDRISNRSYNYICLAIYGTYSQLRYTVELQMAMVDLEMHIETMLWDSSTVEEWLFRRGYIPTIYYFPGRKGVVQKKRVREYRIRWIDHMIEQVKRGEL